jgi:hypothetical protein
VGGLIEAFDEVLDLGIHLLIPHGLGRLVDVRHHGPLENGSPGSLIRRRDLFGGLVVLTVGNSGTAADHSRKSRPLISTFPAWVNWAPAQLPLADALEPGPL